MDTIFHGATGATLGYCLDSVPIAIAGGTLGALPDVIGYAGLKLHGTWNWYSWAHTPTWWKWVLFPWGLHIYVDLQTHKEGHEWWSGSWWVEVVGWAALIAFWILWKVIK